ncbi:MAG: glutamine-hydrolyzing carbamoyl-phosphate synthase small subunit [Clostridia bacterium]|nr:glutamine-hydrolyzing carbamoyl-phosphate synthase small subunit [Clostridia bacterium]MBN2883444.1 glutamine-hydrolyzing carbamoyl-phosphate synthase small subunit [Clostridia bacterium]
MKALLILEDGTRFIGESYGDFYATAGEIVFNTGMTGYQEVLTDPSYCGQIVTMTYPLIGNYGINEEDYESRQPFVKGFITRERCEYPSNFRCKRTLDSYLKKYMIPGLFGIDTRKLTKILREKGTMKGALVAVEADIETAVKTAFELIGNFELTNPVEEVTVSEPYVSRALEPAGYRIAVLDYGVKKNIIRSLNIRGADVTVFPSRTSAEEILAGGYDGVMLSNGPGDPKDCIVEIQNISKLMGKIPIFAICLGHQLTALAMGGNTEKLKYGHRGCNHPVKDVSKDRTYITSQNHGYTVVADSLTGNHAITHINMNDGTVEGVKYLNMPLFTVQFHPEASPGPKDTGYLFDEFFEMIERYREGESNAS